MSFARCPASRFASLSGNRTVAGAQVIPTPNGPRRVGGGSTLRSSYHSYPAHYYNPHSSSSHPSSSSSSTSSSNPAIRTTTLPDEKTPHTRFSTSTPPKISVIRSHGVAKSSPTSMHLLASSRNPILPPSSSSSSSSSSPTFLSSSSNSTAWRKKFKLNLHAPPKGGWCSLVYSLSLGVGLGFGMIIFSFLRGTIDCDSSSIGGGEDLQGKKGEPQRRRAYTLDQVTLLCLVGVGASGKSTQAKRLPERFRGFEVLSGIESVEEIHDEVQRRAEASIKNGRETLLILDGFPHSLEEARRIEETTCPIFVVLYFDLPKKKYTDRAGKTSSMEDWEQTSSTLLPLVNHFRHRGNILEISADWDSPDEVWEQVEAKVEQVLELKEMGEDVSVA